MNTTAPALAGWAGKQVTAIRQGECTAPLGEPPFSGFYGACSVGWSGSDSGRLVGHRVADLLGSGNPVAAYRYPLFSDYAVLAPSPKEQVAGMVAVLITIVGVAQLLAERRRRVTHDDSLVT